MYSDKTEGKKLFVASFIIIIVNTEIHVTQSEA